MNEMDKYATELEIKWKTQDRPSNPLYWLVKLTEEMGELAEVVLAINGDERKALKIEKKGLNVTQALRNELGDCFNVVMLLADYYGIMPEEVVNYATSVMIERRKNAEEKRRIQ